MKKKLLTLAISGLVTLSASVSAAPISFVFTGFGSGTLDSLSFGPSQFTITETSDTANIESCGAGCFSLDSISASITIDTIGTLNFLSGTRTFANTGLVGFSRATTFGFDLYNVFDVPGYALDTSTGPVPGVAQLLQWTSDTVNTSGGVLVFEDGRSEGTFTALTAPVPLPAAVWLLGSALGGMGLLRRRTA